MRSCGSPERKGRVDEAERIIEANFERVHRAPSLHPRVIKFYKSINKTDKANKVAFDCSFTAVHMRDDCARERKGGNGKAKM